MNCSQLKTAFKRVDQKQDTLCSTSLLRSKRCGSVSESCCIQWQVKAKMALANVRTLQHAGLGAKPGIQRCMRLPISQVKAQAGVNGTSAAPAAPRPAKPAAVPVSKQFTNINRFVVPKHLQQAFLAEWRRREQEMQRHAGFVGFNIINDGEQFTISSSWATIPEWEDWSLSPECRRSHLPWGIWQFVPKKGEGFPEDFVPFKDYDEAVNAKY